MSTTQNNNGFKTYVAAEAISQGARVKINASGQVALAGATEIGIGIAEADVASAGYVTVKHYNDNGTFLFIVSDASITAGDAVYAGASGKVTTTANTYKIGVALETGAEADAQIECACVAQNSSPYVVIKAGTHSWAGGAATTDSISVTGMASTDIVIATLKARAATETLVLAANDYANNQIDLTLSANGTNTTTKIDYAVLRSV